MTTPPTTSIYAHAAYQPLVFGWRHAAATDATPLNAGASRGAKYYYICSAVIFARPVDDPTRTSEQIVAQAARCAASPAYCLAAYRELCDRAGAPYEPVCTAADNETCPMTDDLDDESRPAEATATAAAFNLDRATKTAMHVTNRGNTRKGWRAYDDNGIVPAAKAAGEIDAMTPQVCPVDAALVANVPGAPRYNLKRVIFNKTIDGLKHCVGAGTNHTTYERIKGVCKHGGADYFYNFGVALARGEIHDSFIPIINNLRALCIYKPDGGSRPLGLPESEARALLACIATQEKPAWHTFYTSPLRKDVEAREREVDMGRAALAGATTALSAAAANNDRDGITAATTDISNASAAIAKAKKKVNHPINLAFSESGCQKLCHALDICHDASPCNDTISDDIKNVTCTTRPTPAPCSRRCANTSPTLSPSTASSTGGPRPSGWSDATGSYADSP